MKCYSGWSYRPYAPLTERRSVPVVVRLSPSERALRYEFIDDTECDSYIAEVKTWEGDDVCALNTGRTGEIMELDRDTEYTLTIRAADGRTSLTRRFRTGFVPGTVINYLHPEDPAYAFSGSFLCSPSLMRLPSGALLASMDLFGHATPQNLELLFRSDDDGATWHYVTDIMPCFWGRLFIHRGSLYMMGISNEYGDVLIGRSDDEGKTWGTPTVLLRGSCCTRERGCHRAPMHFVTYAGRLWTTLEYGSWYNKRFSVGALSAPTDADLLDVNSWTVTGFTEIRASWFGEPEGTFYGAIEGNLTEGPDGGLYSLMRCRMGQGLLFRFNGNDPDAAPAFVQIVDFDMAHSKCEIIRRPNGSYLAIGNRPPLRNILSMYVSDDLVHWKFLRDIENRGKMDPEKTAFQYPTAFEEDNTIYLVSRTAFNGAASFHDTNYTTFYRVSL